MTTLSVLTAQLLNEKVTARQKQLGILRVTGVDAKKLLQGQASCDINKLSPTQSLYGAICNIKGRIITSFFLLQIKEDLFMLMDETLVEKTLLHLKKYAVFFKAELLNASTEFHVYAHFTDSTESNQPDALSEVLATQINEDHIQLQVAKHPVNIQWLLNQPGNVSITEKNSEKAQLLSLLAARPLITLEQSETILPQWLNMQRTGGISFTKGCYTGQEIVARMQYRGKSKKQLALVTWEESTGGNTNKHTTLFDENHKTIGTVFSSAQISSARINAADLSKTQVAQVILNIEPSEITDLFIDDQKVTLLPLPYGLKDSE